MRLKMTVCKKIHKVAISIIRIHNSPGAILYTLSKRVEISEDEP